MSINYIYIISIAAFLFLIGWSLWIETRIRKFFGGKKAQDLESILVSLTNDLKKLNIQQEETKKYLETVEQRLKNSIQTVNAVRFNPFEDAGSNQSFSIAFLNEHGDGVVISSLYSRDDVKVYAKPIKKYESEYTLSDEEKKVITASQ